jgi:hypothetical protein
MNLNDFSIPYNPLETMAKPKQFITFIPTNDKNSYAVATSRQYTKELAERDIYMRLEAANVPCRNKVYTRELVVDEDGVIRIIDDNGEVLSLDTWKL